MNQAKKEKYTINKDFKLVDTFVKYVCSDLKKVGNTCKSLEEKIWRVPENLSDKQKMQYNIFFTWKK